MYYEINENTAKRAKEMMSYSDYKKGSATEEYKSVVNDVISYAEKAKEKAQTEEGKEKINNLVDKFSKKYADWVNRYNEINCYCPSVLITGAGNFPTRKKQKQNDMMDKHMKEYNEIMKIKDKIRSIVNGSYIIKSGDEDAIERLEKKITDKEANQKEMKEANAHYRKNKTMQGYKNLSDDDAKNWDEEIKNSYSWCQVPYPSFCLSNNNQEIHRLKNRLESLKKAKETPTEESENEYFKIVRNSELMRLQLFFDDIPSKEIRDILKHRGFRWSGKNKAWQRHLNGNSEYALNYVLEELKQNKKALTMRQHDESNEPANN